MLQVFSLKNTFIILASVARNKNPADTFFTFHEAAHELFSCSWAHRAVGAVGAGARGVRVAAVVFQWRVEAVVPARPQQRLQRLDVADGVAQDLHFGQPLVGIGGSAAFQGLKGGVYFAEPTSFSHGRCFSSVFVSRLCLAGLAGPQQAVSRLVWAPRGPHMLILGHVVVLMVVPWLH